ncbi:hypothetical protein [Alicyclobacillus sp. SP_1]|uniref:hypothetical protein n=1 Tax=Alicyclobacillus sp. SP_1 TaxID=2942475 RepID=UPI0021578D6E|nr:hypothetical protein [Alicyclobacillus sp. SP_1]MCY0908592.1 hypothetical protein [Sulfobacillus thermotolerans]
MKTFERVKEGILRGQRRLHAYWATFRMAALPGSFEEMTGRAWMFVAVIVAVLLIFGPKVLSFVENALGTSINTTSNAFNFPVA